jgi:hypothetical protein
MINLLINTNTYVEQFDVHQGKGQRGSGDCQPVHWHELGHKTGLADSVDTFSGETRVIIPHRIEVGIWYNRASKAPISQPRQEYLELI